MVEIDAQRQLNNDKKPVKLASMNIVEVDFETFYQDEKEKRTAANVRIGQQLYSFEKESGEDNEAPPSADKELPEEKPTQHVLQYTIRPIPVESFIASLPVALQEFIQETVTIVKMVGKENQETIHFKFKSLDMNIVLKPDPSGKLTITVDVKNKQLKEDLLNHQKVLVDILNKKFSQDAIDLTLEFQESTDSSSQQNQQQRDRQKEDNPNETD